MHEGDGFSAETLGKAYVIFKLINSLVGQYCGRPVLTSGERPQTDVQVIERD